MNPYEIKKLRMQSLLKEILPEALASLGDPMLNGLSVNDVECKRGQYDAFVYLDKMYFDEKEQNIILSKLKKVSWVLEQHCLSVLGTYRCPKFHFKFDTSLEKQNQIKEIFKIINSQRKENGQD